MPRCRGHVLPVLAIAHLFNFYSETISVALRICSAGLGPLLRLSRRVNLKLLATSAKASPHP